MSAPPTTQDNTPSVVKEGQGDTTFDTPIRKQCLADQNADDEIESGSGGGDESMMIPTSDEKKPLVTPSSTRKRRRPQQQNRIIKDFYDCMMNMVPISSAFKGYDAPSITEPFLRLLKRRSNPHYYNTIKNPIDLLKIQQKVKGEDYENIEELKIDIDLLIDNAVTYYGDMKRRLNEEDNETITDDLTSKTEADSILHKAEQLKQYVDCLLSKHVDGADLGALKNIVMGGGGASMTTSDGDDESTASSSDGSTMAANGQGKSRRLNNNSSAPIPSSVLAECLEEMLGAVVTSTSAEGMSNDGSPRPLHLPFRLLPSQKRYPEYYKVINEPMDLKTVSIRIRDGQHYKSLNMLEEDLQLVFKNAMHFNEPGSQIYRDAKNLVKVVKNKKVELEATKLKVAKAGERVRSTRRSQGGKRNFSQELAEIEEIESESEESEPDQAGSEIEEDPLWALYNTVRHQETASGVSLAEPFLRLPSKRDHPDYYVMIDTPISLTEIRRKLKSEEYSMDDSVLGGSSDLESLKKLAVDFETMFDNCKAYNRHESRLYKEACKLQKVMRNKLEELQYDDEEEEEEEDTDDDSDAEDSEDEALLSTKSTSTASAAASTPGAAKNRPGRPPSKINSSTPRPTRTKAEILYGKRRRKMQRLCKALAEHRNDKGVKVINPFMELPSRASFPDYYEITETPIDLKMIKNKINGDKGKRYQNEMECFKDLKLMFENCKNYNEEDSDIYSYAEELESVLMEMATQLNIISSETTDDMTMTSTNGVVESTTQILTNFVDEVRSYEDTKGRILSTAFIRLPTVKESPEYYEVITNPMDFDTIYRKIRDAPSYSKLGHCLTDVLTVFENACRYNEPDSQLYRDALSLQMVARRVYRSLIFESQCGSSDGNLAAFFGAEHGSSSKSMDVKYCVQDILMHIFTCMYNHQDADERCYSDSLMELPEYTIIGGSTPSVGVEHSASAQLTPILDSMTPPTSSERKVRALNLDIIKRRLDLGLYTRLDSFQRDVFLVLERARSLSKPDSQIFEDSVELQLYFLKVRDECCKSGEVLQSKALSFTRIDLMESVDKIKAGYTPSSTANPADPTSDETMTDRDVKPFGVLDGFEYRVGDFVYAPSDGSSNERDEENKMSDNSIVEPIVVKTATPPALFQIATIFESDGDESGVLKFKGRRFFFPVETFHVANKKFLENEVFSTDIVNTLPLNSITGRCVILSIKDYFKFKVEGFSDEDTYVCESKYKSKTFQKRKTFWKVPEHVKLVEREHRLTPKRVMSVFKERIERHKAELEEIETMVSHVDEGVHSSHGNVVCSQPLTVEELAALPGSGDPGASSRVFYDQYTIPGPITVRRGDMVYVRSENGRNLIAQIYYMWSSPMENGMAYFYGPWFVTPSETTLTGQLFHPQETFMSTISDANPLLSVVGTCSVLDVKEYIRMRPTQYGERDVYFAESIYDESRRVIAAPLPVGYGIRKFVRDGQCCNDEVYFFKQPLAIKRTMPVTPPQPSVAPGQDPNNAMLMMKQGGQGAHDVPHGFINFDDSSLDAPPSVNSDCSQGSSSQNANNFVLPSSQNSSSMINGASPIAGGGQFGTLSMGGVVNSPGFVGGTPSKLPGGGGTSNTPGKKEKRSKQKTKTGYQVYSGESWFRVKAEVAARGGLFADISREVGNQWRQLTDAEKQVYEEKARQVNERSVAKQKEEARVAEERRVIEEANAQKAAATAAAQQAAVLAENSAAMGRLGHHSQIIVSNGGSNIASQQQALLSNNAGHSLAGMMGGPPILQSQQHHANTRNIGGGAGGGPQSVIQTGQGHLIQVSGASSALAANQGQHFLLKSSVQPNFVQTPNGNQQMVATTNANVQHQQPSSTHMGLHKEPIFHLAPPRPQRLLHSETYIKYIEGLTTHTPTMANWSRQLNASFTKENAVAVNNNRLPKHWIRDEEKENSSVSGGGVLNTPFEKQKTSAESLWALRDFMMQQSLGVVKIL